jgi:hypothetical protein
MKDDDLLALVIQKFRWLRLPGIAGRLKDIIDSTARRRSCVSVPPAGSLATGDAGETGSHRGRRRHERLPRVCPPILKASLSKAASAPGAGGEHAPKWGAKGKRG